MAILTLHLADGPFASSPWLVISDAHPGLEQAIEAVLSEPDGEGDVGQARPNLILQL